MMSDKERLQEVTTLLMSNTLDNRAREKLMIEYTQLNKKIKEEKLND